MPTIMIIPAGIYQVPAIMCAKQWGLRVVTADYLPENPGHRLADRAGYFSILDQESVLSLAREEQVDAIFTMASDIAVKTVSYVSRELGLSENLPFDAVDTICLKNRFRAFQRENGFNYPPFISVSDFSAFQAALCDIGYPLFVKPADSSGSKGVFYLGPEQERSEMDLRDIYLEARSFSRNKLVCVEKYIDGLEIGGDAFVLGGRIVFCVLTNKYITPHPLYVPIGHSIPSVLSHTVQGAVEELLQQAVSALKIDNGPINFDVMVGADSVVILEMSPRLGGNCIPAIVQYATGFDMVEAALQVALGVEPAVPLVNELKPVPTGVRILRSDRDGVLRAFTNPEIIRKRHCGVLELVIDYPAGAEVKAYAQGADRLGHLICSAGSVAELEKTLDRAESALDIIVE